MLNNSGQKIGSLNRNFNTSQIIEGIILSVLKSICWSAIILYIVFCLPKYHPFLFAAITIYFLIGMSYIAYCYQTHDFIKDYNKNNQGFICSIFFPYFILRNLFITKEAKINKSHIPITIKELKRNNIHTLGAYLDTVSNLISYKDGKTTKHVNLDKKTLNLFYQSIQIAFPDADNAIIGGFSKIIETIRYIPPQSEVPILWYNYSHQFPNYRYLYEGYEQNESNNKQINLFLNSKLKET